MNEKNDIRLAIGRLLRLGIMVSFTFIIIGGVLYLAQYGGERVDYRQFHGETIALTTYWGIFKDALAWVPEGIIQLGLVVLFLVQILRVALTGWYFWKLQDRIFVVFSVGILLVLVGTLAWSF